MAEKELPFCLLLTNVIPCLCVLRKEDLPSNRGSESFTLGPFVLFSALSKVMNEMQSLLSSPVIIAHVCGAVVFWLGDGKYGESLETSLWDCLVLLHQCRHL